MSEYDLSEIDLRIRRNRHVGHGRPAKSYVQPFWALLQRLTTLTEAFPHVGIQEAVVSALNHLEMEDVYRGVNLESQGL